MGGCVSEVSGKTKKELRENIAKFVASAKRKGLTDNRGHTEPTWNDEKKVWEVKVWVHS